MQVFRAGQTLYFRESPISKPHLWFILTDPEGPMRRVVAVMLQSAQSFTDKTVILEAGDHPFVKHASSIHYSTTKFFKVKRIVRAMKRGLCHLHDNLSQSLLKRAQEGLLVSARTPQAFKDYCKERFD